MAQDPAHLDPGAPALTAKLQEPQTNFPQAPGRKRNDSRAAFKREACERLLFRRPDHPFTNQTTRSQELDGRRASVRAALFAGPEESDPVDIHGSERPFLEAGGRPSILGKSGRGGAGVENSLFYHTLTEV
jgi:hypothetical protein